MWSLLSDSPPHTFSIGDRSGVEAGQSNTRMPMKPHCRIMCSMRPDVVLLEHPLTS